MMTQNPSYYLVLCTPSLYLVNITNLVPFDVKSMFLPFAFFPILEISLLCYLSPHNGF